MTGHGMTRTENAEVGEELVAALLRAQHPDLAGRHLQVVDGGRDNFICRLGEDLAVRLPRHEIAAAIAAKEHAWLPPLARRLPVAVPTPVRTGAPGCGFPWRWSVVPWIHGATAASEPLDAGEASRFASFLSTLHTTALGRPRAEDARAEGDPQPPESGPGPAEGGLRSAALHEKSARGAPRLSDLHPGPRLPKNPFRGVPLRERTLEVEERLERLRDPTDAIVSEVLEAWRLGLAARPARRRRCIHGDLHPGNVITSYGGLAGVIDWGDLTAGDAATDLAAAWMLFDDPAGRAACLEAYGASKAQMARAMGWAVFFGSALLDRAAAGAAGAATASGLRATRHRTGAATLRRVAEDIADPSSRTAASLPRQRTQMRLDRAAGRGPGGPGSLSSQAANTGVT